MRQGCHSPKVEDYSPPESLSYGSGALVVIQICTKTPRSYLIFVPTSPWHKSWTQLGPHLSNHLMSYQRRAEQSTQQVPLPFWHVTNLGSTNDILITFSFWTNLVGVSKLSLWPKTETLAAVPGTTGSAATGASLSRHHKVSENSLFFFSASWTWSPI